MGQLSLIVDHCSSGKHCKGQGKAWLTCVEPQPQASMWVIYYYKEQNLAVTGTPLSLPLGCCGGDTPPPACPPATRAGDHLWRSFGQELPQALLLVRRGGVALG